MELFNQTKIMIALAALLLLGVLFKWSVDTCLPLHPGSHLFAGASPPAAICEPILDWDIWAREQDAKTYAKTNWYNEGPGLFETDDGRQTIFIFAYDALKLTIVFSLAPMDTRSNLQLIMLWIVCSVLLGAVWELMARVVSTPIAATKAKQTYRRRMTAMFKVLGSNDNSPKK